MKTVKNVDDLAASLTRANSTPLVAPPSMQTTPKKAVIDTLQVTLRPPRALYAAYVNKAAERSKTAGRTVSAQEIMLEVLQRANA
jgi:hypothetical protein